MINLPDVFRFLFEGNQKRRSSLQVVLASLNELDNCSSMMSTFFCEPDSIRSLICAKLILVFEWRVQKLSRSDFLCLVFESVSNPGYQIIERTVALPFQVLYW